MIVDWNLPLFVEGTDRMATVLYGPNERGFCCVEADWDGSGLHDWLFTSDGKVYGGIRPFAVSNATTPSTIAPFTPEEVEAIAEVAHKRWAAADGIIDIKEAITLALTEGRNLLPKEPPEVVAARAVIAEWEARK